MTLVFVPTPHDFKKKEKLKENIFNFNSYKKTIVFGLETMDKLIY
jgi:hypothetical protein